MQALKRLGGKHGAQTLQLRHSLIEEPRHGLRVGARYGKIPVRVHGKVLAHHLTATRLLGAVANDGHGLALVLVQSPAGYQHYAPLSIHGRGDADNAPLAAIQMELKLAGNRF